MLVLVLHPLLLLNQLPYRFCLQLMAAADTGQAAAVALLLAAAPEAALETDPHEFSALHLAAAGGHAEATRLLLEAAPQALAFRSRYNDTGAIWRRGGWPCGQ